MNKGIAAVLAVVTAIVGWIMWSESGAKYETPACFISDQAGLIILVDTANGRYIGTHYTSPFGGELVYSDYKTLEEGLEKYNFSHINCKTGEPVNAPNKEEGNETTPEPSASPQPAE